MLKYRINDLNEVEEKFRALYKEDKQGEKTTYVLLVEGAADVERVRELQKKINEFRTTNAASAELLKVFAGTAGIDLEDVKTPAELTSLLKDKEEELKTKGSSKAKDIEAEVAKRTEQLKKELEAKAKAAETRADGFLTRLSTLEIDNAVAAAATAIGVVDGGMVDISNRARAIFVYEDGKVVAKDAGGNPMYGRDAVSPLTISEWVQTLATSKEGKHLFATNSGGGASGAAGGAGRLSGAANPFKKETLNRTEQLRLIKTDPSTAKRLAAEAGVTLPQMGG